VKGMGEKESQSISPLDQRDKVKNKWTAGFVVLLTLNKAVPRSAGNWDVRSGCVYQQLVGERKEFWTLEW
jgi:hypothetical protein